VNDFSPVCITLTRGDLLVMLANILLGGRTPVSGSKDAVSVIRRVFVNQKIACIKFVRTHADMTLREAKDFVENHVYDVDATESYARQCAIADAVETHTRTR
jgi:ribosomal protein L7/L12